ncbi:MAG TPA: class II aldolase/adducin family protein [Polyangiales bacterium]|nr:class II aldolase/adducin family protein [Polyangiales bacterium]
MTDVREEMVRIIEELYRLQLITSTGGNVSARHTPGAQEAFITPSASFKGKVTPATFVRIDLEGEVLEPHPARPSSETPIHVAILRARPDIQAVVHVHAPRATTLVNADLPFLPISTESAFLAKIGRIPFVVPGTPALASAIVDALGQGWAVLMQNHGLIVAARSLRRAADIAQIVERTADIILGCYSAVGRPPPVLPPELVAELSSKEDLMA